MSIYENYKKIQSKKDFEEFLKLLVIDCKENKQEWENNTLELFLEALYGYNFESDEEEPSWKKMAEMLLAAKVYE